MPETSLQRHSDLEDSEIEDLISLIGILEVK